MYVRIVSWRSTIFNNKKAFITSFVVAALFFFLNFHLNFSLEHHNTVNTTFARRCMSAEKAKSWFNV